MLNMFRTLQETNNCKMEQNSIVNQENVFWERVEFNRYGILFVAVVLQSCIASVAIAFVSSNLSVEKQTIPLILLSITAMGANAANIALAPMKWIIGLFLAVVAVSIAVFCYTLM